MVQPPSQQARALLTVLTLSAFGPYLVGGFRTEHLAVYLIAVFLVPYRLGRIHCPPALLALLTSWMVIATIAAVGYLWPPVNATGYRAGSAVASLDNLVLPATCALVTLAVMAGPDAGRELLLRRVTTLVIVCLCANVLVALAQLAWPLDTYLDHWWSSGEDSVATRAIANGRYTGIFNQPALAGIAYSLGLFCAIYRVPKRPVLLATVVVLLSLGGILAVSKSFFLIGLPLAAWYLLRLSEPKGRRLSALVTVAGLAYALAAWLVLPAWSGINQLRTLLPGQEAGLLETYTGSRYGEAATTRPILEAVLTTQPVSGYGLSGLETPYDSAWVAVLVIAGVAGMACLAAVLVVLIVKLLHSRNEWPAPEHALFGGLVVLITASSFGFPVLTGNGLAILIWVLLTILMTPDRQAAPATLQKPQLASSAP